jgi:hypothetical protein
MELNMLYHIIEVLVVGGLTYYINKNDAAIKELNTSLIQVRLDYAKKEEIKEIKDLIERGFDKLEARLERKQDKEH